MKLFQHNFFQVFFFCMEIFNSFLPPPLLNTFLVVKISQETHIMPRNFQDHLTKSLGGGGGGGGVELIQIDTERSDIYMY